MADITTKTELVKLLSKKTGYSREDCGVFLDGLADIFEWAIVNGIQLRIPRIGTLLYERLPQRVGRQPIPGEVGNIIKKEYPPAYRLRFSILKNLRALAKGLKPQ